MAGCWRPVATSRPWAAASPIGNRSACPGTTADAAALYVSAPYLSWREDVFTVSVGRALVDAKGAFAGVVTAQLEPEYFKVLLRSVLYAADMRTALLHGDGTLFLYVPPMERGLGEDRSKRPSSPFNLHRASGRIESVLVATSTSSGDERMTALRTLQQGSAPMDRPLVVAVSRELAAIYLPWRRQAALTGGLFLLLCGASILGLLLDQRRRRALARTALAQDDERRDSAERLELALAGADLGCGTGRSPEARSPSMHAGSRCWATRRTSSNPVSTLGAACCTRTMRSVRWPRSRRT